MAWLVRRSVIAAVTHAAITAGQGCWRCDARQAGAFFLYSSLTSAACEQSEGRALFLVFRFCGRVAADR